MNIRPDVVIADLSSSVILEVKAAELVITDMYPTKRTLRFPRVVRIRFEDSKPWNEAMTKEDLDKMVADFSESRRLPGKRIIDDLYESGESDRVSGSDEEVKVDKKRHKRLKPSVVTEEQMMDILKPQKPKPKLELKSKVVAYF